MIELHLSRADFRLDWFSGRGAGGQHRNKHQNCCRITHIETGLTAVGQDGRDRSTNQRAAFKRLAQKLLTWYAEPDPERRAADNVVRTYHFERAVVTDGMIRRPIGPVMDGDLDDFLLAALTDRRPRRRTGRC